MRRMHRWWWAVGCVLLLSGCHSFIRCPYKDANIRFGSAGEGILEDMPAPKTPGEQLRLDAFRSAVEECKRLGNE